MAAARTVRAARVRLGFGSCVVVAACGGLGGCAHGPRPVAAAPGATGGAAAVEAAPLLFEDVAAQAGFTHRHRKPVLDHQLDNIMPWVCSVGAAAAAADFDGDGWIDLYVTSSRKGEPNRLYRNDGDGTFTDVAGSAGVAEVNGDGGVSMDCAWGDCDNDGDPDLYVVRWGTDVLFRNDGDGTFTDVTADRFRMPDGTPGAPWANGNAVIFLDYDLDGRLDIYVGNYFDAVDLWHLKSTRIMHESFETARNGGLNFLYRQEANGTFTEVAADAGVQDPGWTLAVGAADVNGDGWPDLYCADDFGPDQLFFNGGDGTFRNVTGEAIGYDTKKGMNVDFGDFNNDGWLDIYVANITTAEYLQEGNMLWHNNGPGPDGSVTFTDVALETGTYDGGWGWGAKFFDADDDGDLDIVAVNGFISAGEGNYWYDLATWTVTGEDSADARNWPAIGDRSFSGYEPLRFWRNEGWGTFTPRAEEVGLTSTRDGRGVVCFDYDNDGDVDLYIANHDQPPHLFRNQSREGGTGNHWLEVALEADPATGVNRDAIGARVTIVTASGRQVRERDGGNGYAAQSDPRLHFGLGADASVELLEVRWPDGGLQYIEDVPADRLVTVRQDPAQYGGRAPIRIDLPRPWAAPAETPKGPRIDPAELERQLASMEAAIEAGSAPPALASRYRSTCATNDQHDRSIAFFRRQVREHPLSDDLATELACAYVDKIPTCGGIAAIVSKGTLAKKSLDVLDIVIARSPDLWVAYYCRAMNHLHWPRALRHSDEAAADFDRCIELQALTGDPAGHAYYVRAHVGLGDARVKDRRPDLARAAWRDGLSLFPDSIDLQERLAIDDDRELERYVEKARSLEEPIDTDLGFETLRESLHRSGLQHR